MDAVVSGHAGVALLLDGEKLASIHFGEDGVVPRSPSEVSLLFSGAGDLRLFRNVEPEEVREQLDLESKRIDALHLALILLDSELSEETRQTAAEELEEELADQNMMNWLEGVLFAHPLPPSADLVGANAACSDSFERTRTLLLRLESHQPVVKEVCQAWEAIPLERFGTEKDRQYALSVLVREGVFRSLAAKKKAGEAIDGLLWEVLWNSAVREIQNSRHVLLDWVSSFLSSEDIQFYPPKPPERLPIPESSSFKHERTKIESTWESTTVEGTLARVAFPRQSEPDMEISSSDLVYRIQEGDAAAESELVARFSKSVASMALRLTGDLSVAEDIFQETFLLALETLRKGEVRDPDRLGGFLRALTTRLSMKRLKRDSRRRVKEAELDAAADLSPSENDRFKHRLHNAFALLDKLSSQRDRQLLFRFYIAEEDKEQIRSDLGLTIPEFNMVLFRARRRFRNLYERHVAKGEG